ncbi:MAG: hypothetical protein ACQERC_03870 [Bacteroidota bacterium]
MMLITTRVFILAAAAVLLNACSDSLCDCVEKGREVNALSAELLDQQHQSSAQDSSKLIELRENYYDECEEFRNMEAEALHKAARDCPSLQQAPKK